MKFTKLCLFTIKRKNGFRGRELYPRKKLKFKVLILKFISREEQGRYSTKNFHQSITWKKWQPKTKRGFSILVNLTSGFSTLVNLTSWFKFYQIMDTTSNTSGQLTMATSGKYFFLFIVFHEMVQGFWFGCERV